MAAPATQSLRLSPAKLCRGCDPRRFKFTTTADLEPLVGTVGQDRAVSAMDFGLSIEAEGFHVFVSGPPGTGRSTELRTQLERIAAARPAPQDWCYVFNFRDPARPRALSLPAGRGHQLEHDIDDLITALRREVPRAFESDEYAQRREEISREMASQRDRLFETLQREAETRQMQVNVTGMGISTVPILEGKPMTKEQFDHLPDEQKQDIQRRSGEVDAIIAQLMPQLRRLDRAALQLMRELDRRVIQVIAAPMIDEVKRDYAQEPQAVEFLDRLAADVIDHLDAFRATDDEQRPGIPGLAPPVSMDGVFSRYKVNVVVTHTADARAPAVFEDNPTYYQMFGRIDFRSTFGSMVTDHTMIRPGALHRANGGFLAVHALDVLTQPLVWATLKRALRTRQIRLENMGEQFSVIPTASLTPEPIPLNVKVALIGSPYVFAMLQNVDEDFRKLFKARADFTTDVGRDAENELEYARFVARQVQLLGMRPFDRGAVARVIEHSSRLAGDQQKLSLRMEEIVDVLVEADYWACDAGSERVTTDYVERAVEQKVYRANMFEERLRELIASGIIKVDIAGSVVGQVNGLSVHDIGDYAFGRPSRITARVSLGRGQVMNIEREVQRSGPAHSKGFLILTGYLNGKFAHRQPLSFAASIAFEQVYDEIDGDSASSTELYALLSAIADIPLRQDLAVTGSVNQLGDVQAIGGVNEKIEGFYALCNVRGLTGTQGVMIPRDNVRNLMLKREVVEAVGRGAFHIYAVASIDQGIEILTGLPAGRVRKDGTYPEGSIYRKVTDALEAMTRRAIEVNRAANQREPVAATSAAPGAARDGSQRRKKVRGGHRHADAQ